MPTQCAVAGCKNSLRITVGVSYFRFPSDIVFRDEWIRFCRQEKTINPNHARICSAHFTATDYERNLQSELLGIKARYKLKKDAVPSIFPNANIYRRIEGRTVENMVGKCINPKCGRTENLITATSLRLPRFFGVKRHGVGLKLEICQDCMNFYEQRQSELVMRVKSRIPVLTGMMRKETANEEMKEEDIEDKDEQEPSFKEKYQHDEILEIDSEEEIYEVPDNLEEQITNTLVKLDFRFQIHESLNIMNTKVKDLKEEYKEVDRSWDHLEETIKKLRTEVEQLQGIYREEEVEFVETSYQPYSNNNGSQSKVIQSQKFPPYPIVRSASVGSQKMNDISQDIITVEQVSGKCPSLPPVGPIVRKELQVGMKVYAMKASYFGIWYKAKIIEIRTGSLGEKQYKVRFEPKRNTAHTRILSGKHLAYVEPADVSLPMGVRIIAQYRDEYWNQANSMYAGIIAEPPKMMNSYRYLVFFDDGYAQYINHNQIHLVCEVSKDVWDDIHPDSKEFIRSYLLQYPERPMVKLQKGQVVKTEWNGKWWIARVVEVDASLVKMYFDADKRTEWIYRGSTRLGPLYSELANAEANKAAGKMKRHNLNLSKRKNAPYVEYTRGLDEPIRTESSNFEENSDNEDFSEITIDEEPEPEKKQVAKKHSAPLIRTNVAKKSTSSLFRKEPECSNPIRIIGKTESDGYWADIKFRQKVDQRVKFTPHNCGRQCIRNSSDDPVNHKGQNPLLIPMLCGWERQFVKFQSSGKRLVFYRTPCGKRLRSIEEVHDYLTKTYSQLSVDLFCFNHTVHCFTEFVPAKEFCLIKDISYGKENVPVSCVNSVSRQYPEYVEYSTRRLPAKGVHLNLDQDFLVGCDCVDDCKDSSKCLCQQLTLSTMSDFQGINQHMKGYQHRRLHEQIVTGIYECNPKCKCRPQCLNRVAQNGLQLRLQVFKTERRGWGLRCLDDIPQGCFICIYAGQLLTEQGANEDGTQYGDEYLAELDYIEVVERLKEGYESDVMDPENEDEKKDAEKELSEEGENEDDSNGYEHVETTKTGSSTCQVKGDDRSSDSDFEIDNIGPISPRARSSRFSSIDLKDDTLFNKRKDKVQKLVLRRGHENETTPSTCGPKTPSDSTEPEAVVEEDDNTMHSSSSTLLASDDQEQGDTVFTGKAVRFMKQIPALSPNTLEELQRTQLVRKPRLHRDRPSVTDASESEDEFLKLESSEQESEVKSETDAKIEHDTTSGDTDLSTDMKMVRLPSRFCVSLPDKMGPTTEPSTGTLKDKLQIKYISLRNYFGEEYCYIMDAKSIGNIGRYLNHSCSPNVFVQNVFVDTHDLRFPWVAFFAMQYIRAGTELTWDYNYDVGSVPGKVLYCYCESSECRGRLL